MTGAARLRWILPCVLGLTAAAILQPVPADVADADRSSLPASSPPAPLTPLSCTPTPDDINGDGAADLVVGEPRRNGQRGAVHVLYGRSVDRRAQITVDAAGSAPDDAFFGKASGSRPGDVFGLETALGDYNGDGCADVAVGAPSDFETGTGSVSIFFGSRTGLRTTGHQTLTLAGLRPGPAAPGDRFGANLVAGDLDDDGITDLALTSHDVDDHVVVAYGSATGLGRTEFLTGSSTGLPTGPPWSGDGYGQALAIGDVDGNGLDDLVVAVGRFQGIQVLEHRSGGLAQRSTISTRTPGLPRPRLGFEDLGITLAAGDVTGDGRDDLALGAANARMRVEEAEYGAGLVIVLRGSARGLTTAGSQMWTQDSAGVQGRTRLGNMFGADLEIAKLDGDRYADLAVGAPGDGPFSGSVTVLRGSGGGLTAAGYGGSRIVQSTPNVAGTDEPGDLFGQWLTSLQGRTDTSATLVVGAPGEAVGPVRAAGSVTLICLGGSGPLARCTRRLSVDTPGVRGQAGTGNHFGWGPASLG